MPGPPLVLLFALQLLAAACASDPLRASATPVLAGRAAAPVSATSEDQDHDGLCDVSEQRLQTNAAKPDTDADGFPDVVEVLCGYSPTDPTSPAPDQVGYLVAQTGRKLDLELRSTIDGDGQDATGQFLARNTLDAFGLRASDFFVGGLAVSAEPPDNVRGIQADSERFASVLGKTRLTFRLHFEVNTSIALNCAAALAFDYAIKSDVGGYVNTRNYMLVVTPSDSASEPADFCLPLACL